MTMTFDAKLAAAAATTLASAFMLSACQPTPATAPQPVASMPSTIVVFDYLQGNRTVSPDWTAINAQPFGSKGNPVRVFLPDGQRAYLNRLVCSDGSRPAYQRRGNVGEGPYTTIVDLYDVACGTRMSVVYMDMYHQGYVETRVVPGFTMRP